MIEIKSSGNKRKIRSRFIRSKKNLPSIRLTARDFEILQALADYRLLSTFQVKRLFFRSIHKTRKRLFKLWQHGFVDRRFQPVKLGQGNIPILYTLSRQGARMLARQGGVTKEARYDAILKRQGSFLFIEHTLAISEFRINLVKACEISPDSKLLFWKQGKEIKSRVSFIDGSSNRRLVTVSILPDAYFGLQKGKVTQHCYFEMDRGSTTIGKIANKLKAYHALWLQHGRNHKTSCGEFKVIIVTSSCQRMKNIMEAARHCFNTVNSRGIFIFAHDRRILTHPNFGSNDGTWSSCEGNKIPII